MKAAKKFRLSTEIPTSSQSDIAFLLIIFFIVTAIFFERTGILFKVPGKSSKPVKLTQNEFIKIDAFNDYLVINGRKTDYKDLGSLLSEIRNETLRNIAIIYFSKDLKYKKFIAIFDAVRKTGDFKISIKPLSKK